MDTSEIYIKMSEKAVKIQEEWKPQEGDFYSYRPYGDTGLPKQIGILSEIDAECIGQSHFNYEEVWLPTQDRLQDMMLPITEGDYKDRPLWDLFHRLNWFLKFLPSGDTRIKSWTQLWLAFVMKEKYNKIWNGEDWKDE